MSWASFLDIIRQYASASQRKHRSFEVGVNAVRALWHEKVAASDMDEAEKARQRAAADDVIMREYGKVDVSYKLPSDS